MPSRFVRAVAVPISIAFGIGGMSAQTTSVSRGTTPDPDAMVVKAGAANTGAVLRGFNAGVSAAGVHASSTGWYMIVTPFATYDFSEHYSADVSLSIYPYRYTQAQGAGSTTTLIFDGGDVGDTLLEAHAVFAPKAYRSISTASLTFPTGNVTNGLGTGRVTFSLDERVEHYFGQTGIFVDVGGGDSTGLQNRLVTEDDAALGPLGLFQAGVTTWLPKNLSLQSSAYEQLPIGDQKTYTTLRRPGFPDRTVVSGRKVNEDNGLNTTLYIPLTSQFTLAGSYNRSLRLHLDTVSTGITFVWKGSPLPRRDSLIDRAMRAAESTGGTTR